MNNLFTKKYVLIGTLTLVIVEYATIYPEKFGICRLISNTNCIYGFFDNSFRDPFFILSLFLLATVLLAILFRDQIFRTWLKFSFWVFPLTVLVTMVQPNGGGGYFPSLITKEIVSWWAGGAFAVISLVLITYKHLTLKKS